MRIAIFSDNFYPELGGIQDSIISLAKSLGEQGHRVDFYAPWASKQNFKTARLPVQELDLGKNVKTFRFFSIPFPSSSKQSRAVIPTGLRWLALQKFRPDVIHTQTFFGVGLDALIAGKVLHIPVVGTNHWAIDAFSEYTPFSAKFFSRYSLGYVCWYYNRCNFVTAPSESVFTTMLKHGFDKPHQVVSNPIETKTFKPLPQAQKLELKKQFGLSKNTVVFAGRQGVEKRIDVVIRAVAEAKKQVPDINLGLAGHGMAEKDLKKLAEDLGLETAVKFFGTLEKQRLAELYNASEIFAIASTSETQSMTLMQAMATGLPAVGVNSRALPEYITHERGFIVEPGDSKAMGEKFAQLFKNPGLRENLGKNAGQFVQNLSSETIGQKWLRLYAQVIAEAATHRTPAQVLLRRFSLKLAEMVFAAILGLSLGIWVFGSLNPNSAYAITLKDIKTDKRIVIQKLKNAYKAIIYENAGR